MSICINSRCPKPENSGTLLFCQGCGSELLLVGRYRVTQQLGGGGFGKTFEVSDRDGSPKVLKVLINNYPNYVELFQQEAQVLSHLNHPGIPQVEPEAYFTFFPRDSTEPLHCLVMEKIEGLDLSEYLQHKGSPIDQKLAIQWLTQLANILNEVHSQNFFHRDIKPQNIMLRSSGHLVLIDFGTARAVTGTFMAKQAVGQVTGVVSAGYTPPEQFNGQAVPQSDFFALGRTFVYLLTGKDPSELYDPHTDELHWHNAAVGVSPIFANFLDQIMARLPSQRLQTAEEILQRLAEINSTLYPSPVRSQLPQPVNNPVVAPTQPVTSAKYPPTQAVSTFQHPVSPPQTQPTNSPRVAPTQPIGTPQATVTASQSLQGSPLQSASQTYHTVTPPQQAGTSQFVPLFERLIPRQKKAVRVGTIVALIVAVIGGIYAMVELKSDEYVVYEPYASSSLEAPSVDLDSIIQSPDKPIPVQSLSKESITSQQLASLNSLFEKSEKVDSTLEPVTPGKAAVYKGWKCLCLGEEGIGECPRSAEHEVNTMWGPGVKLFTSRGWIAFKP